MLKIHIVVASMVIVTFFLGVGVTLNFKPVEAQAEETPLYCYDPYGEEVEQEWEVDSTTVHINWLDSERGGEAWSSFYYDEETNSSLCAVYARRPEQILGDPDMDALGHEFLHCLIGEFHSDD